MFPAAAIPVAPTRSAPPPPPTTVPPINPFDVLGIPRGTSDENVVNEAYRKWALILHPDRGGDPRRFQAVTLAYGNIMELLKYAKTESFEMLKQRTERDMSNMYGGGGKSGTGTSQQSAASANPDLAPLGSGNAFDHAAFNQVFADHRMWEPSHDGYGDRMQQHSAKPHQKWNPDDMLREREQELFSVMDSHTLPRPSTEDFNNHFSKHATAPYEAQQQRSSTSMVRRVEPEVMDIFRTSSSMCGSLSYEKVDDYSSPFAAGGANFTDYMKAFSTEALITPHVENSVGHGYRTVKELQSERSQLSFVPSPELLQAKSEQDAAEREQDEIRYRNFLKQQEIVEETHRNIRNVLPERKK